MKYNIVRLIATEFLKRFLIALHLFLMVISWLTAWVCPCMCGWRWGWRGRWGWRSTRRRSSWCRPLREDPRSPAIKWGLANSSDQSECNRKWTFSCWQWFQCHIFNLLKPVARMLATYDQHQPRTTIGTKTTMDITVLKPGQRGQAFWNIQPSTNDKNYNMVIFTQYYLETWTKRATRTSMEVRLIAITDSK